MPYTITLFIALLIVIFMAFTGRAKGGAIPFGDQRTNLARFVFGAIPNAIAATYICFLWHLPFYLAAACAATTFIAETLGHSDEQIDSWEGYLGMSYIMTISLVIMFSPFLIYATYYPVNNWIYFLYATVFGLYGGFADWLGYRMKGNLVTYFRIFGKTVDISWCAPGDSSWGELYRYAMTVGFAFALLTIVA